MISPRVFLLSCLVGAAGVWATAEEPGNSALPAREEATQNPPNQEFFSPQKRALGPEQQANLYMARKMYDEAIDFYQQALKTGSRDPLLWNRLGVAWQFQGNMRQAQRAYKRAYQLDRKSARALNNLGTTFYMVGRHKKSLKYYRRALQLDPDNSSFHLNLGTAYFHRKKYAEAAQEYRIALNLDSGILGRSGTVGTEMQPRSWDERMYFEVARIYASMNRFPEAVRYLRRALEDGFDDFGKIKEDSDLLLMAEYPPTSNCLPIPRPQFAECPLIP